MIKKNIINITWKISNKFDTKNTLIVIIFIYTHVHFYKCNKMKELCQKY